MKSLLISAVNCYILRVGETFAGSSKGGFVMDVQRSHFRRYLSISLVVLFMLTLAALGYATWTIERENLQGWEMLLNLLILSLPLLLIYGSIYVLVLGRHERSSLGK